MVEEKDFKEYPDKKELINKTIGSLTNDIMNLNDLYFIQHKIHSIATEKLFEHSFEKKSMEGQKVKIRKPNNINMRSVKPRRGNMCDILSQEILPGELLYTTDKKILFVGTDSGGVKALGLIVEYDNICEFPDMNDFPNDIYKALNKMLFKSMETNQVYTWDHDSKRYIEIVIGDFVLVLDD